MKDGRCCPGWSRSASRALSSLLSRPRRPRSKLSARAASLRRIVRSTPEFERATGNTVMTSWGPSMGETPEAVPARLRREELIDVVIMVGYALGDLVRQGKVDGDSRVDLARSGIGVVVRAGAPKPDISSVDALKGTLLQAKSIAYSDSASGVYISTEMFKRLGIADQVASKARMIPAEPVGAVVARGEAEIGFQQISELKPIAGIDLVGRCRPKCSNTRFSRPASSPAPRSRRRPAMHPIPRLAGRRARHHGERHGADDIGGAEMMTTGTPPAVGRQGA